MLDIIHNELFQILRGIQSLLDLFVISIMLFTYSDPDIIGLSTDEDNRYDQRENSRMTSIIVSDIEYNN